MDFSPALPIIIVIVIFLLIVFTAAVKVVQEYERGVVFRLGRLVGPRGPGLILLMSPATYRASAFRAAAERAGLPVVTAWDAPERLAVDIEGMPHEEGNRLILELQDPSHLLFESRLRRGRHDLRLGRGRTTTGCQQAGEKKHTGSGHRVKCRNVA